MPGDPGFDYFDPKIMKAAYEALPKDQRTLKIEAATYLDRVQKSMDAHVEFGPSANNCAHALRNAARGYQSSQETTELDAETAYSIALKQWLAGGSIGKRPQLSDFSATRRSVTQKAETRLSHCIDNLFASGICP